MIWPILYQLFVGLLAWTNYVLINNNRKIYHGLNGVLHISAALLIGYFSRWNYGVSCLLFTRVVFDGVLYALLPDRGLGYVSPKPISWADKIESWIVFELVQIIHKSKTIIPEEEIERVAICFRIFILGLATGFLFV